MRTKTTLMGAVAFCIAAAPALASEKNMSPRAPAQLVQPQIRLAQSGKCSQAGSLTSCIACMQANGRNYSAAEAFCSKYY